MPDRTQSVGAEPRNPIDDAPFGSSSPDSGLGDLLRNVFQRLSDSIAGDDRLSFDVSDPQPEADVEGFLPGGGQALDPDLLDPLDEGEDYDLPDTASKALPSYTPPVTFDPAALPEPSQGKILRNSKGYLVYTTGVGEAPDNKANAGLGAYQQRASFVTDVYGWVQSNFDVAAAGQHRDHDAEVTANRSANSDHYSDGAFDVRANSPQEALRVLAWASTQPWVSFAQIYPDGSLVHISANIAAFTGSTLPSSPSAPQASRTVTTTPGSIPEPSPTLSTSTPPPVEPGRPS